MRFRRLCTDAVQIEYLVAYKRVVHYCKDCDAEAGSRVVTKGTNNKGRKILVCSESCGWTMMLPQCYCNRHAEVAFAKTGKSYYRCGSPDCPPPNTKHHTTARHHKTGRLRILDAFSGCGTRAARYLSQSGADFVHVNDANEDMGPLLLQNLEKHGGPRDLGHEGNFEGGTGGTVGSASVDDAITSGGAADAADGSGARADVTGGRRWSPDDSWRSGLTAEEVGGAGQRWKITHSDAHRVIFDYYLNRDFFDIIDCDSFGLAGRAIGTAMHAVKHGGMLYLTQTDGRASGGHFPERCVLLKFSRPCRQRRQCQGTSTTTATIAGTAYVPWRHGLILH